MFVSNFYKPMLIRTIVFDVPLNKNWVTLTQGPATSFSFLFFKVHIIWHKTPQASLAGF